MSASVPSREPSAARAGDTWAWTRDLADYPAGTWTLTYTLFSTAGIWPITATADGATHAVNVAPAQSSQITAGRWDWVAQVSNGTDFYQVGSGVIQVLPDLTSADAYDGRSYPRRMFDAVRACLEGRQTEGEADLVSAHYNDRSAQFDGALMRKDESRYGFMVQAEDNAERLARGEQSGRFISTRFTG
jgi:hypothetical protein